MPTSFANQIDNLDIYAKRAECDAAGNTLSTTYATKAELPGSSQLVPSATSADEDKVLTVDSLGVPGWAIVPSQSTGLFQATYGTSTYNEVSAAVTAKKIVYCAVSGRMAFLAYVGSNNYEFQYYRSNGSSSGTDSVFVYKVTSEGWTTTERPVKAGNISYPVTQVNVNGSSAMTGTVANITVQSVPAVTSSDNNKVLKASYSGGTGSYSWQTESGGGGAQADWTESDQADPSYIQNKPTIVGIAAGSNVSITEANNTLTIAATDTTYTAGTGISISNGAISNSDPLPAHTSTESGKVLGVDNNGDLGWVAQGGGGGGSYSAGTGIDITAGTISVDTTTVAMKTDIPTVPTTDQTYNSSSTNPQSGTAVAGAISGVAQVPSVTSSDNAKVLTASYSGGVASYSWQTAQGGGGGGTSNVTTADKQINVAVNGTGLPMQLNLLNPVGTYSNISLGSPTIYVKEIEYQMTGDTFYAPVIEWTFSRSAIAPSNPSAPYYRVPLTLSIPNDIIIVSGSDRVHTSNHGIQPNVYLDVKLLNASDDSMVVYLNSTQYIFSDGGYNDPPGDIKLLGGTYGPDEFTFNATRSIYDAASTLRLSMVIDWTFYDEQTGTGSRLTQQEAQAMASAIAQQGTMTLTAPSGSPTAYTSYIGSTAISGQTTTSDSSYSGLYRYDFSASETAALVPGTYLVQVNGPSSSGNQSTYVCLFKGGNTGYNNYISYNKVSYLSSSGSRSEMFLMNVEENTTAIGTKVNYGGFTMVRLG